jgi:hypothetical protein
MLPLLLLAVSVNSGSGNGFLSGIFNFFNQFFAPSDPPQLVSVSGNAFDLPNSNVVEITPNLPSQEMPINPFANVGIPQSNFNLFQNSLITSTPFNTPSIPNIPVITTG